MIDGFTPFPADLAQRYRDSGYWLDQPLGDYFRDCCARFADRIAIIADDERVSYGELNHRVERMARHFIRIGFKPLDRVILQLPNTPEFLYVYLGFQRIGVITLLALPAHRRNEIGHYVNFIGAVGYAAADRAGDFSFVDMARDIQKASPGLRHLLILGDDAPDGCISIHDLLASDPELPREVLDVLDIDPGEPAVFLLSGGTTGMPKIIPRTHNDYVLNSIGCSGVNHMDENTRLQVCLPIAHNFPLASPGIQGVFVHGGVGVITRSPHAAEILPVIEREKITHLELVPAALIRLLHDDDFYKFDLSSVRIVNTGGQRLQPEAAALAEQKFSNGIVQEVFGMAEGLVMLNDINDPQATRFEVAGPVWCRDDEIRLVDDEGRDVIPGEIGEMICRGPYTLRGYFNLPDHNARSFTADGFFITGDLMRQHSPGRYVVEGRKKDLINRGGEKISAEEVENLLLAHDAVRNVACVPIPDPILGERTCAYVIPAPGAAPTLDMLCEFLLVRDIAKFKLPERLELVDAFPLSPFGKVSKKDLTEMIAAKLSAEQGE